MASVDTIPRIAVGEDRALFSLIESEGLGLRLCRELSLTIAEFRTNPKGFFRGLFSGVEKDQASRRRGRLALAVGAAVHLSLLTVILVVGWSHFAERRVQDAPDQTVWIPISALPESAPKESGPSDAPKGDGRGGGGGGQRTARPPSVGTPPMMAPIPQIVSPTAPETRQPSLALPPTVVGPPEPPPPPDAKLGTPKGEKGDFNAGSGDGGGLGTGKGTGVGSGTGPGVGPGSGGGRGGGKAGLPNGTGAGPMRDFDWRELQRKPLAGFTPFKWIYRPTPIVTPEARAIKPDGYVLLRATFNADGTITDIDVINPMDFMTESAIESLAHSRFRPATLDGVPVTLRKVTVKVVVHW
jgi:hypothetical protein